MIPPRFKYLCPASLDEAIAMLGDYGPEAKVLAGGQSLIPMMKLQLAAPAYIVDINRIPGLEELYEEDEVLHIGCLTRETVLDASQLVRSGYPILHDTAAVIADPLVRNMATVGGNLAHGDPGNDHPATMLALGAQVTARGPGGDRTISLSEFFVGPLTTALEETEILTEIQVRKPPPGTGSAYLKLERKVGDYATAGVAAVINMKEGVCQGAGIGLTNAGVTPIKATGAEAFLAGKQLDDETIREAARLAAQAASPSPDLRGSEEYKRDMVRVLTIRAIRLALARIE
jgi:carbon-monoxide dehydrogenase medium subunit